MNSTPVRFTIRQSLSGFSTIGTLLQAAHYAEEPPSRAFVEMIYKQMVEAHRSNDLGALYRDTIVFCPNPFLNLVGLEVNMSNLQFFGAALYEGRFAFGYEPEILALLSLHLPDDGVFYDIGSNWGYFTLHCLLDPEFSGGVIAVEPSPGPMSDLRRFLRLLGLDGRVITLEAGCGDVEEISRLSDEALSGLNTVDKNAAGPRIDVKCLDQMGLPAPAFVKIDVEGYELRCLKGMRETILRHHPAIVLENWKDTEGESNGRAALEFLEECGYKLFASYFRPQPRRSAVIPFEVHGQLELVSISAESRGLFEPRLNIFATVDDF